MRPAARRPPAMESARSRPAAVRRGCGVVVEQVMRELAPADLRHELARAPLRRRVQDLPRRDLAEVQVRREARGAGDAGQVAALAVVHHGAVEETAEVRSRARFARSPSVGKSVGQGDRGLQAERVERHAVRPLRGRGDATRGRRGRWQLEGGGDFAPERAEYLERLAAEVLHIPGLGEERGVEAAHFDAFAAQRVLDRAVAGDDGGFVATAPMDSRGTGLADQRSQRLERGSPRCEGPQDQL